MPQIKDTCFGLLMQPVCPAVCYVYRPHAGCIYTQIVCDKQAYLRNLGSANWLGLGGTPSTQL